MIEAVFPYPMLTDLASGLLKHRVESCAVVFCRLIESGSRRRLLAEELTAPSQHDYAVRTELSAELSPEFVAKVTKIALNTQRTLLFLHTHPMSNNTPQFSSVDLAGEEKLAEFYQRRLGRPAVTGILAPGGAIAKVIGSNQPVKLLEIGPERKEWTKSFSNLEIDDSFERQVRAFGISGQLRIQDLRIGIVGLGGTGSVVLQQLAYLGARDFVLMDADVVESTNLNRLVGANPMSVGIPKVAVARDLGQSINPKAHFQLEHSSINVMSAAKKLCDTDFIFCCTDSHGSRAIIGQLAYQYLIPTIDMGVVIVSKAEHITHIAGRVQMLAPSLGCFACGNLLDPDAVRHDLMTTFERQADPYFLGQGEPQPSVISLNSTIASLAITMFLAAVAGVPSRPRFQIYNGIAGTVRAGVVEPQPRCVVCSSSGALGKADEWTLPARLA